MINLYYDTKMLDERAISEFGLSEEILQENAASKIEEVIRQNLQQKSKILFVCGSGNNAADAICTARKLSNDYECDIFLTSNKLNLMASMQLDKAKKAHVNLVENPEFSAYECFVDGIFGSGLNRDMSDKVCKIINELNKTKGLKIAVDIPSGITKSGKITQNAFIADFTITMGALKLALFLDSSKDLVGKIILANLGISKANFETISDSFLLEKTDLNLPFRHLQDTNKGNFGHLYVISGDLKGAAIIAANAGFSIGAGLVSVVSDEKISNLDPFIMQTNSSHKAKVVVAGCGLGEKTLNLELLKDKICVIDADLCYKKEIIPFLEKNENLVLTPHPKEFASLLNLAGLGDFSIKEIQANRFDLARKWSEKFNSVLVLKGANTIVSYKGKIFVSSFGSSILAKAGSGDALAGIIGGLLAQNYSPLEAAINGVLAHSLSVLNFKKNSYALTPNDIIEGIKCL
ncbi:bifunctional ADP-dependent NAD(P)H-hydrate dehydratase/NAD(P)H-hydrate epimerase [Campylobacter ureolyticus]|uniref:Bifunctional NAD(P)H-hydrate repair enzyme n=1 Tax=Campylobacter ureolyticus TaxID=827 RepID=A0A2I1N8L2_9BACT|nr:NAD(P)H-hydrate dehydratase [Campylobacter ureolyticus]MDU7070024.1 NAD(P)H-hydrate dehydratase [Campylobacter ureolyticus]PKZ28699.1 bifunctional ADP-dependent NAD(P)H-hydrate dehydratase/NAD(P)H-hydrate epimerase [Campylobacter ureolyticus]